MNESTTQLFFHPLKWIAGFPQKKNHLHFFNPENHLFTIHLHDFGSLGQWVKLMPRNWDFRCPSPAPSSITLTLTLVASTLWSFSKGQLIRYDVWLTKSMTVLKLKNCQPLYVEYKYVNMYICIYIYVYVYIYMYLNPPRVRNLSPFNDQKQTWGLKFDTLGGSRYVYILPRKLRCLFNKSV